MNHSLETSVSPAKSLARRTPWLKHTAILTLSSLILLVLVGQLYDLHLVEKVLTRLAMPCGLVWLGLLLILYSSIWEHRWKTAGLVAIIQLGYWFMGCTLGSQFLISLLESDQAHVQLDRLPPLDGVIVLGGGMATNSEGDIWLSGAGDRVNFGAILYLQKKTPQLIATGAHYPWARPNKHDISSSTALLWQRLGIPASDMVPLSGQNTTEEMAAIHQWLDGRQLRLGLVTSAFHMPRALRLARNRGLEFVALPSDFRTRVPDPLPLAIVPNGLAFSESELVVKEFLAWLLNR